jgi:C-terminal processing protease CtpA/Prc
MKKILIGILGLTIIAGIVLGVTKIKKPEVSENKDKYVAFSLEIYDKIKENYWEKISDDELSNIFLLSVDRIGGLTHSLKSKDRVGVEKLIEEVNKDVPADKKKEFFATVGDFVLANLKPLERSRLYSQKDEISLNNTVNNINEGANHFESLGVSKSAGNEEIKKAFDKKIVEATTEAKKTEITKAYEVLKDEENRKIYDVSGAEPTIEYKLLTSNIFYVHLTKFSPNSLDEFVRVMNKTDSLKTVPNSLIFDLRDNIGGAIDQLPYFLGPFIGADNYAYQFYRQGEKEDFKTRTGWLNSLVKFKKVVILVNENSQSSAEVMAGVLKKYNVGLVVGKTTRGWGTVERVVPMETIIDEKEKFSLFLVHRVTLRDDGQPIEGRGVDPTIFITDPNWKKEFLSYYNNPELVEEVGKLVK